MPPRAASSISRIMEMTIDSSPYDSSTSLCHLHIPPERHRRHCKSAADRVMVMINLLLMVAGWFVLTFTSLAASIPVLGLCITLCAGCSIALGLLGVVATTKLTGLLYLHFVLMATLQAGSAFTVGSVLLARVDIARLTNADMFLKVPGSIPQHRFAAYEHACDYYADPTSLDSGDTNDGAAAAATAMVAEDAWERCWDSLGQSHDTLLGQSPLRYAVLIELCACVVLLVGMATSLGDLGVAATTELSMFSVEAIVVVLGSAEAAFGVWVMLVAPSHSLGLFILVLGSSNAIVGLLVAFWYTQCAHRFRWRVPGVPVAALDPEDYARSRRRLRCALCVHLVLLLAFGIYVLQPQTLTNIRDYAYEYYCTSLPPGLIEVNAGPTSVLVARVRAVSADTAIASSVGVFSLCAAVFTLVLLSNLSYYIARLTVDDRDSML